MKLLTQALRKQLPKLYAQEKLGGQAIAYVKFFFNGWTWYATEFDGKDTFFGLVVSPYDTELGYFSLSELQSLRSRLGYGVERDLYWAPTTLAKIRGEEPEQENPVLRCGWCGEEVDELYHSDQFGDVCMMCYEAEKQLDHSGE